MKRIVSYALVALVGLPLNAQLRTESSPSLEMENSFFARQSKVDEKNNISNFKPSNLKSVSQRAFANPYDVPFIEDFKTSAGLADWYIQDVNNNGECWAWWEAGE